MSGWKVSGAIWMGLVLAAVAWTQSQPEHPQKGAAGEIGAGVGDAGVGAAKGAGDIAKGTAKGAGDLVTLHPIDAGTSIGKGAAEAGKDVTVGAAKGTGKVGKGIGRLFKKIF
jgi:hypothetical protein